MGEQTQAVVLSRSTEAMKGLRQKGDQEWVGTNMKHKFNVVSLFFAWEVPSHWLLELFNRALCVTKHTHTHKTISRLKNKTDHLKHRIYTGDQ